jgi:uncharacterized protein (DUF3084 family)
MKFVTLFFLLNVAIIPTVAARDVLIYQQRASFAYNEMRQAGKKVVTLSKASNKAESQLQRAKQQHEKAQQKSEAAKIELEQANQMMLQAEHDWKQASDTLAQAWERTRSK